jgi:hypothetical protein
LVANDLPHVRVAVEEMIKAQVENGGNREPAEERRAETPQLSKGASR